MSEANFFHFTRQGKFLGVDTVEEAVSAMNRGGFIWLDYYNPDKDELIALIEPIGIHPLSVEDCFDVSQIPKIDLFTDHTFIIFNSFTYTDKVLYVDEVALFIGRNFLVTVSGNKSGSRRPLNDIIKIIGKDPGNAKAGPAFLMHIILDYIVDQKFYAFDSLEEELDLAEDQVLNDPESFDPSRVIHMRKDLMNLRKSLFHEREILIKICRMDSPFIQSKVIIHYRDIYDHLTKFFELAETYRDYLTSLLELYTSLLNNIMTRTSNATNISVRRLTLITTIFMPLTLLAGIGGMSEWTMITGGPENWKTSYALFIVGLIIIGIINYYLIRRMMKEKTSFKTKSPQKTS